MMRLTPLPQGLPPGLKGHDMAAVYRDIKPDLDRVEEQLEAWSQSPNPLTAEVSRYILKKKGKRLRPALVLLASRLFKAGPGEQVFLASLVELIHTASLIHDDIIDKADVRRGEESVHAKWGPNVTVLLGDHLYIRSIGLALESRYDRIIHLLADASARMIEGELDELAASGDLGISEERYLEIIGKKTAVLFTVCCRMGAILGRARVEDEDALAEFGRGIGLGFQIVDDILDFTADEKTLGKPVMSDLTEGRVTLPLIHALRSDGRPQRERISGLVGRGEASAEARAAVLELLGASGSLDYAAALARRYAEEAVGILGRFPESAAKRALATMARFIVDRSR
jgi:octaprenyl-diphosphate synthase